MSQDPKLFNKIKSLTDQLDKAKKRQDYHTKYHKYELARAWNIAIEDLRSQIKSLKNPKTSDDFEGVFAVDETNIWTPDYPVGRSGYSQTKTVGPSPSITYSTHSLHQDDKTMKHKIVIDINLNIDPK